MCVNIIQHRLKIPKTEEWILGQLDANSKGQGFGAIAISFTTGEEWWGLGLLDKKPYGQDLRRPGPIHTDMVYDI